MRQAIFTVAILLSIAGCSRSASVNNSAGAKAAGNMANRAASAVDDIAAPTPTEDQPGAAAGARARQPVDDGPPPPTPHPVDDGPPPPTPHPVDDGPPPPTPHEDDDGPPPPTPHEHP